MSGLQKEAIQMISTLSDDNLNYLIDFMKRFMFPKNPTEKMDFSADVKAQAFYEMEQNKATLSSYFPLDFNPKEEYMEAMEEKYGNIG